jgi:hypothetical protein
MRKARFSVNKRQRERTREDKRKRKEERRQERKLEEKDAGTGEDPDLAGIVPGPQPKPWDEEGFPVVASDEAAESDDGESEDGDEGDSSGDDDAPAANASDGDDRD